MPMAKPKPKQKVIIAMKGHPGTGKSTLARVISAALKCPLLDKDDVRDATLTFQQTLVDHNPFFSCSPSAIDKIFNQLCYQVLFQMVSTQLSLGLNVVVDSPLSRKSHLDRLVEVAADSDHPDGAKVVVVECKPQNEDEWRRRLEERAAVAAAEGGGKWHKPATWADLERLLEEYGGCYDYDTGGVQKLVLDTTATGVGVDELVSCVVEFISATACGDDPSVLPS